MAQANAGRGKKREVAGMIEVLKRALTDAKRNERHNNVAETRYWLNQYKLIAEQAIAELESQEPVATVTSETGADITMSWWHEPALPVGTKLFTYAPQRTWQGLTDEEVESYWDWEDFQTGAGCLTILKMVRDIEAKLKEKNS